MLGPDTNTLKTPSHICAASVWIWKGGIKKNSRNIFFKISPNLFREAVFIDKDWQVTYLSFLPMSLSDFTPALFWWVNYRKFRTISRDFFLTLSTLRLMQRCGLFMHFSFFIFMHIYACFNVRLIVQCGLCMDEMTFPLKMYWVRLIIRCGL